MKDWGMRVAAATVAGALVAAGLVAAGVAPAGAATQTAVFVPIAGGGVQTYTVPPGADSMTINLRGGGGGTGGNSGGSGGRGGKGTLQLTVAPGDVIGMLIGGRGNNAGSDKDDTGGGASLGQWSGGGGNTGSVDGAPGGGGGAATVITLNGTLIAVAGGGAGGGGKSGFNSPGGPGGDASQNGADGGGTGTTGGGIVGGSGGTWGGTGGNAATSSSGGGGGGGAGGWEGGSGGGGGVAGGGGGGGGAGGTSYYNDFLVTLVGDWGVAPTTANGVVQIITGITFPTASVLAPAAPTVNREMRAYDITVTASNPTESGDVPLSPTGTVQLSAKNLADGSIVSLGEAVLTTGADSQSTATVYSDQLTAGSWTLRTAYLPDGVSDSKASLTTQSLTVAKAATTTDITVPEDPAERDATIDLSAHVDVTAPGRATPTGTVQFRAGSSALGTPQPLDAAGNATLTTDRLTAGTTAISAVYAGDAETTGSTSVAKPVVVGQARTTITVSSAANPVVFGNEVVLDAHVTSAAAIPQQPTGQVQFYDGEAALGQPVAVRANGDATLRTTELATGLHRISARYLGSAEFKQAESARLDQVVNPGTTRVLITGTTSPSPVDSAAGFDVVVEPTGTGATPTGAVRLVVDGVVRPDAVPLVGGRATASLSGLSVGSHQVLAQFLGDAHYAGAASGPIGQVVIGRAVAVQLVSDVTPADPGRSVRVLAKLTSGASTSQPIAGSVQYYDNGTTIGAAVPVSRMGWGGRILKGLKPGRHRIVARFVPAAGSAFEPATSNVLIQTVSKTPATARLRVDVDRAAGGGWRIAVTASSLGGPAGPVVGRVRVAVIGGSQRWIRLRQGRGTIRLASSPAATYVRVGIDGPVWRSEGRLFRLPG